MADKKLTLFRKYCQNAISKLSPEFIETFKAVRLNDDISRIKLMYDTAKQIYIDIPETSDKDIMKAKRMKNEGNKRFERGDYDGALERYNLGIITCPQETVEGRELLTILISNRSATFFELNEFKRVFNDIDYIMRIGDYPAHLEYKLWLRKGKCYDALQNKTLACEAYNRTLKCLTKSDLNETAIKQKKEEIKRLKESKWATFESKKVTQDTPVIPNEEFVGGADLMAAHPSVTIQQDDHQGRYAIATGYIPAGTIILEETAFCSVVDREHALTNCQYCLTSVDQPIACPGCAVVVFCSNHCQSRATKTFHGVECGFQKFLYDCEASVNYLMAMRLISQTPVKFFRDKQKKLTEYLTGSKTYIYKKSYRSDDYENVFSLCRNEDQRNNGDLIHYACVSVMLLRILKFAKYFGESDDDKLTEEESYIGSLILRHLQLLQFNAHEISELTNVDEYTEYDNILTNNFANTSIGAGLYPTLSLFNHSCDPSIVRYNIKNKMVVRAIKPIKENDIIYENYGPLYMSDPLRKRQMELKNKYWFECLCEPCVQLWPLFSELETGVLKIPCQTVGCPFVFDLYPQDDPYLICEYCNITLDIYSSLMSLMTLENILPEAENLLSAGQLVNAYKKFLNGLEILYKHSEKPHSDIVKVQQRIRTCMLHFGNRCCNYKLPFVKPL